MFCSCSQASMIMNRFPGDVKFILWAALFWAVVMLAMLPFGAMARWMGWL